MMNNFLRLEKIMFSDTTYQIPSRRDLPSPSAGCQVYPARYGGNGQKKALLIVRRALIMMYLYRQALI